MLPAGAALPIGGYTGRLCLKGLPFFRLQYMKEYWGDLLFQYFKESPKYTYKG